MIRRSEVFQMGEEAGLVLFLKVHKWHLFPRGKGSCLGGCSQVLKELPSLLKLQREACLGGTGNVPVALSLPRGHIRGTLAPTVLSLSS